MLFVHSEYKSLIFQLDSGQVVYTCHRLKGKRNASSFLEMGLVYLHNPAYSQSNSKFLVEVKIHSG